jgi:putative transposase
VSRFAVLSDAEWDRIAPFMPTPGAKGGRPYADHRTVVLAAIIVWLRS